MPTATVENYVKRVYLLAEAGGDAGAHVSPGALAAGMGVSPGTVTTMLKGLAKAGLASYEPRRGVKLTPKGETLALRMLRKHRLVEMFLVTVLKLDWAEINEEAEQLEHAVSDRLLEKIDAFLDRPEHDPHGDPIPTAGGKIARRRLVRLAACARGARVRIACIRRQDAAFLRYVLDHRLTPGEFVRVLSADPAADVIRLRLGDGSELALGGKAAGEIEVEPASRVA